MYFSMSNFSHYLYVKKHLLLKQFTVFHSKITSIIFYHERHRLLRKQCSLSQSISIAHTVRAARESGRYTCQPSERTHNTDTLTRSVVTPGRCLQEATTCLGGGAVCHLENLPAVSGPFVPVNLCLLLPEARAWVTGSHREQAAAPLARSHS